MKFPEVDRVIIKKIHNRRESKNRPQFIVTLILFFEKINCLFDYDCQGFDHEPGTQVYSRCFFLPRILNYKGYRDPGY